MQASSVITSTDDRDLLTVETTRGAEALESDECSVLLVTFATNRRPAYPSWITMLPLEIGTSAPVS